MAKLEVDLNKTELLRTYLGQVAEVRMSKDQVKVGLVVGVAEHDEAILSIYFPNNGTDDERIDYRVYELKPDRVEVAPPKNLHSHEQLEDWYEVKEPHIVLKSAVPNEYGEVEL